MNAHDRRDLASLRPIALALNLPVDTAAETIVAAVLKLNAENERLRTLMDAGYSRSIDEELGEKSWFKVVLDAAKADYDRWPDWMKHKDESKP